MKIITEGYDYEVLNDQNGNLTQAIHFSRYRKENGQRVIDRDGTSNEELLEVLISRFSYQDALAPNYHRSMNVALLKSCLNHCEEMVAEINGKVVNKEVKTNYP